jgi:hypothetical protein
VSTTRLTGLYAVLAGAAAVFLSPLLALSYFATADGAQELDIGTVSAWADPARDIAGGLLTWASADRVYSTYVQVFALLLLAVLLCAWRVGPNARWASAGLNAGAGEARSRATGSRPSASRPRSSCCLEATRKQRPSTPCSWR